MPKNSIGKVFEMSLIFFVSLLLLLIVGALLVNEKWLHLQKDIATVLFSLIVCVAVLVVNRVFEIPWLRELMDYLRTFRFDDYLLNGVLCFMLFAGASKVSFYKFRKNIKSIGLLSFLTTAVSSVLYGLLFWGASSLFGLGTDLATCILLGCIVSPTDPIAATGILNKLGMSKSVTSVMESEALFNDGVGVALFIFVKSIVTKSGGSNFLLIMGRELFGAIAVAFGVSFLLFSLMKFSKSPSTHVLISLLAVSACYAICEYFEFSGVIASVICGMYFSYFRGKISAKLEVVDSENQYNDFWDMADSILNSFLFAMICVSLLTVELSVQFLPLCVIAVVIGLLARFCGVEASAAVIGKKRIPGRYTATEFSLLMTWAALRGGLSLAMVLSTAELLSPTVFSAFLIVTYFTVFFTILAQGLSVKKVYRAIEKHKENRIRESREEEA